MGGDDATSNAVFYAIRFKGGKDNCYGQDAYWKYNPATNRSEPTYYPPALDNALKCAYRFTRVGGATSWSQANNENLTNQLIIDVVYLGEESAQIELATISDESWWSAKKIEGQVISKTFPAAGYVASSYNPVSGRLEFRGRWVNLGSSSLGYINSMHYLYVEPSHILTGSTVVLNAALPVRLFLHRIH